MDHELDRRFLLGAVGLAGAAAFARAGSAGPLSPPAGAVAPTSKTLAEMEPRTPINAANTPGTSTCLYKITSPGAYYLTGPAVFPVGKNGIEITAANVTIDFNGFPLASFGGLNGVISSGSTPQRITLRNGRIYGGTGVGVQINANAVTLESLIVESFTTAGIQLGTRAMVVDCRVESCGASSSGHGIACGAHSIIERCAAVDCGSSGISVSTGSVVRACAGTGCGDSGMSGSGSTFEGCTMIGNSQGFVGLSSILRACLARDNTNIGFRPGGSCVLLENFAINNGAGTTFGNYYVDSTRNRLERNTAMLGGPGFKATGTGNMFMGNVAQSCTPNWDSVAGNYCQVVDAVVAGAISGNAGGVSIGSTSAWANFTV